MPWFPDMATAAFCETLHLRKMILERQNLPRFSPCQVLEPASAEFLSALAAGSNAHNMLQIGCGLSTIALAAAARATGTCLLSVHTDEEKQDIVRHHLKHLGLIDFVEFVVSKPCDIIPQRDGVDFAFFMGDPKDYIKLFDLLKLKHGAIIIADNALHEATNEYIKHVCRQPGADSSTLPIGRGIEVTKIISWEKFKSGRIFHMRSESSGVHDEHMPRGHETMPDISSLGVPASKSSSSVSLDEAHQIMVSDKNAEIDHFEHASGDTHRVTELDVPPTAETSCMEEDVQTLTDLDGSIKMAEMMGEQSETNLKSMTDSSCVESCGSTFSSCAVEPCDDKFSNVTNDRNLNGNFRSIQVVGMQSASPPDPQTQMVLEHGTAATTTLDCLNADTNLAEQTVKSQVMKQQQEAGSQEIETSNKGILELFSNSQSLNLESGDASEVLCDSLDQKVSKMTSSDHIVENIVYAHCEEQKLEVEQNSEVLQEKNLYPVENFQNLNQEEVFQYITNSTDLEASHMRIMAQPVDVGTELEVISDYKVHFRNCSSQTEVTITGIDQDMLLSDITMAFNDTGVSVWRAKVSTQDTFVEDIFYVIDTQTRNPVHPCRWDFIKERILQRISERRHHAKA